MRRAPLLCLSIVALVAAAACHNAPPVARRIAETSLLRASETSWYLFGTTAVEQCDVGADGVIRTRKVADVEPGRGRPVVSAFDPRGGYGAVAYEHAVACVSFVDGKVRWADAPWPSTPRDLCVSGEQIAVVSGNALGVFQLPNLERVGGDATSGSPLTDLTRWLELASVSQLWFVVPLEGQKFTALGHQPAGTFGSARTVLLEFDLQNPARDAITQRTEVGDVSILGDCAYDGGGLLIASILEQVRRTPGGSQEFLHTLQVVRADPVTHAQRVLVRAELHDARQGVAQLAVERDRIAVVFSDGEVRVWRSGDGGRATDLWGDRLGAGVSVAFLSANRLVICRADGSTSVKLLAE